MALAQLIDRIASPDDAVSARTQARLDGKTKPRKSLGRLESLACRVAGILGEEAPGPLAKAIVVMAADHGVAADGVSAFPQEVTAQMVLNFAGGGAGINVLARQAGARVVVVDMGVRTKVAAPGVRDGWIGPGTRNLAREAAMTVEEARRAIAVGAELAAELAREGVGLIGIGEMGIGNTTSASALTAAYTGAPAAEVVGRGTGIDDAGLARKLAAVEAGLRRSQPDPARPLETLASLGGFEIAGMAGVVLGAAAARRPVVVDGFIAGAAALAAVRLQPKAAAYLVASHRSVEAGHRVVLRALGIEPLLDLDLRLGEGTGAALAMPIVDASLAIVREMATFESAGVSDSGR